MSCVTYSDSVPGKIPYRNQILPDGSRSNSSYAFVNTGIKVWTDESITDAPDGRIPMYGQNYLYCLHNREDARCAGLDREEDHWFYFTEAVSYCAPAFLRHVLLTFKLTSKIELDRTCFADAMLCILFVTLSGIMLRLFS